MKPKRKIVKDHNKSLRESIPQKWIDTCELIPELNFLLVENFYKREFVKNKKGFSQNPKFKEFSKWLKRFVHFIKIDKPRLEKQALEAIPDIPIDKWFEKINPIAQKTQKTKKGEVIYRLKPCKEIYGKSYKQVYGKSLRLEKKIVDLETKFLKELIDYRFFFWT